MSRSSFAPKAPHAESRPETDSRTTLPAPAPAEQETLSAEAPTREMPIPAFALEESEAAEETASDPPPAPAEGREADSEREDEPAVERIDESVPPMGDIVVVEQVAERFFSEGELARLSAKDKEALEDDLGELGAERAKAKSAPHVVLRRARFVRVVTWIAGGAAVLCLAALVRTVTAPHASIAPARAAVATVEMKPAEPAVAAAVAPPPVEKAAEKAAEADADPDKVRTAAPAEEPAPVASEPKEPKAEAVAAGNALADKNASRAALERGRLTEAIEAGERSVAADPEDGEAWLLLGAAYQESGKMADARRCYASCLKDGKRGPKGECAAMLR